jgi:hypothetical protein
MMYLLDDIWTGAKKLLDLVPQLFGGPLVPDALRKNI